MTVISMKTTILVSGPLAGISLQFAKPRQGRIILDLQQYLINRGSQRGEDGEPSSEGSGVPILPLISSSGNLSSPFLPRIFLPFPLLKFLLSR